MNIDDIKSMINDLALSNEQYSSHELEDIMRVKSYLYSESRKEDNQDIKLN